MPQSHAVQLARAAKTTAFSLSGWSDAIASKTFQQGADLLNTAISYSNGF